MVVATRPLTVALVGNPNTGKTTLFNALTGLRQRVGNYAGVTVELTKGRTTCAGHACAVVDLPGSYSLAPRSPDEMVTVDLLLGRCPGEPRPNVVVSIVDASNLDRHLYLVTQALELGVPVVVALNMIDLAEAQGVRLDAAKLAQGLGVSVVPTRAKTGQGLEELKQAIAAAAELAEAPASGVKFPAAFDQEVADLAAKLGDVPPFLVRRLLLDVNGYAERWLIERHGPAVAEAVRQARERLAAAGCPVPAVEARARYAWIRQVTAAAVVRPTARPVSWTDRLDRLLTHKLWGTLIFLVVMFVVFQAIFTWARPLMGAVGTGKDFIADLLRGHLPPGPLASLLCDGVIDGVGAVLVFLPQILILFGFIAVLEDCGYMARAAFLMDKLMSRAGLNGKSFIPLLSSVACAVPGIMATRVIENRRDRLTTILVAPLMSCSARLPVYVLLIGAFLSKPWWLPGVVMFAMYSLGIVLAPLIALALKRTLLRGATPVFVLEMPVYQWPSPRLVLRRMTGAGWAFLRRAGTLILFSMVLVWAALYFPATDSAGQSYERQLNELRSRAEELKGQPEQQAVQERADAVYGEWKRGSYLGRAGRALEPAFRPLGWDWKIGMAALASFPAREVVVGTLGIIYNQGKVDSDEIRDADNPGETPLARAVRADWHGNTQIGRYAVPVALSLMVFFALCCQCVSTLAVIRRETNSWRWPVFTFTYMTALAYAAALVTFQFGAWLTDRLA